MSWREYYTLLEKYDGDLRKATKTELKEAARGNPNDPASARQLAEKKWAERNEVGA